MTFGGFSRMRQFTGMVALTGALAVGLAAAGHMNPLVAAVLMPVNSLLTLIIVTSGMRRAFRPV